MHLPFFCRNVATIKFLFRRGRGGGGGGGGAAGRDPFTPSVSIPVNCWWFAIGHFPVLFPPSVYRGFLTEKRLYMCH